MVSFWCTTDSLLECMWQAGKIGREKFIYREHNDSVCTNHIIGVLNRAYFTKEWAMVKTNRYLQHVHASPTYLSCDTCIVHTSVNIFQSLEYILGVVYTTRSGDCLGPGSGGSWTILLQLSLPLPGIHWLLLPPELSTGIEIAKSFIHRRVEGAITTTHHQSFIR